MPYTEDQARQARYALDKLDELARCQDIRPFRAGDEELVCGNDLIPIYGTEGRYRHDAAFINRLRNAALEMVWPRQS